MNETISSLMRGRDTQTGVLFPSLRPLKKFVFGETDLFGFGSCNLLIKYFSDWTHLILFKLQFFPDLILYNIYK